MVQASIAAGVRRFVFFSTIAVYGPGQGQSWNEGDEVRPDTPYAVTKAEAEGIVQRAKRLDGGALGTVLRLSAVYGPHLKGNYQRLVAALARGRFVPVGAGENRRSLIHDRDLAEAVVLAATHPNAAGRLYNVADGEEHTLRDIIEAVCLGLGRRAPRVTLPIGPVRGALSILERAAHLVRIAPPVSRATLDKVLRGHVRRYPADPRGTGFCASRWAARWVG